MTANGVVKLFLAFASFLGRRGVTRNVFFLFLFLFSLSYFLFGVFSLFDKSFLLCLLCKFGKRGNKIGPSCPLLL